MKTKPTFSIIMARAAMLLLALMTTASSWAQITGIQTDFISELMLIGGSESSTNNLKTTYKKQGWTVIDQNLNEGAGGDYIYLLYKTANIYSTFDYTFITDFYISNAKGEVPNELSYDGRTYFLTPYDGSTGFCNSKGNLNNNAGGDNIHLYYTQEYGTYRDAIGSFFFDATQSYAVGKNGGSTGYNLNSNAGGNKIYMHRSLDQVFGWTIMKNNYGDQCMITGYEGPTTADITSITIPLTIENATVESFGMNFSGFTNLETLYFHTGSAIKEMPSMEGCSKLKNVIMDDGTETYPDELPSSITSISDYAFSGTAIKNLNIKNVTSVGYDAFKNCKNLESVIFYKAASIAVDAFANIKSPCTVTYPGPMSDWSPDIYRHSPDFIVCGTDNNEAWYCGWEGEKDESDHNRLFWTLDTNGHLAIDCYDDTWETYPQAIKDSPWYGYKVKSLTLNHVDTIGADVFNGCINLASLTIPNSVKSIGHAAFAGCNGLTSITVASGNPSYDSRNNCNAIIEKASNTLITGCNNTVIPNSVTAIGDYAFYLCDGLTSVSIPNSVTNIGNCAFNTCTSISSIDIPNSVTSIGVDAFRDCFGLTSVNIPDGVKSIKESAFWGCSNLTSITIPNSVTSIGNGAFWGCDCMTSVTINSNAVLSETVLPLIYIFGNQVKNYTIGNDVKSIGDRAFYDFENMTSITIPNSVTSIGNGAFSYCFSLPSVSIPNSVTSIGRDAFQGCSNVTDVYCYADPSALIWDDGGCNDFMDNRVTICHVFNASDWSVFVDKVNVTFVGDLPYIADNAINSTVLNTWNGKIFNMMLKDRTLYLDGDWNTLCLPFDVDSLNGTPLEGLTVKQLDTETAFDGHKTGVENGTLYLNFKDATSITAGRPYIVKRNIDLAISSEADWNTFAQNVSNGMSYEGKVVRLDADISVSTMASGTFKGTFDGYGHTINVNLSGGGQGLALFYTIDGATIQNVKVTGTVTSSYHRPATFAAFVDGSSTIRNCWSSVDIVSTHNNAWIDGGAFVSRVSGGVTLTMTDCAFTGSVTYNANTYSGGSMVGFTQKGATANLTNCMYFPTALALTAVAYNPHIFVSGDERGNLTNCYYNAVARESILANEGIDGSDMSAEALADALGKSWEVSGNNALPICTSDIKNPTFESVTINNAAPKVVVSEDGAVCFKGGYDPVGLAANDHAMLFMGSGSTLHYPNADMNINSCRAWFQLAHALTDSSTGDVNGDEVISVTDVAFLVSHILGTDNDGFVIANADVNGDGEISVSDVSALVSIIISGGNNAFTVVTNLDDIPITFDGGGSGTVR